MTGNQ